MDKYLSVTTLTKYLKMKFDKDPYLERVYLTGQVSNFRKRPTHQYFSLKDDRAVIQATIWSGIYQKLGFDLEEGMKINVIGRVQVYEPSGSYSIIIEKAEPDGVGALAIQFEQLKKKLSEEGLFQERFKQATVLPTDNIRQVSTKTAYPAPGVGLSVVLVDFGLKHSILRELSKRDCNVTVVPYTTTAEEILHLNPDGVMLSNGPGNPEDVPEALDMIRGILGKIPIFGICMGHQLFAMANGAKTYKMKFGHRGFNHAVREIATGRVDFTSQNHGYAVSREDLPEHLIITHEEINDKSVEGVRHRYLPGFSVQFHPDAAPGPHDASYLFDEFIEMMEAFKQAN